MPGAGTIPLGGGPFGGAVPPTVFNVFFYEDLATSALLGELFTHVTGDGTHVRPDPASTGYIDLISDETLSSIFIDKPVSAQFTLEFAAQFVSLPVDFSRVATDYVYFGATDTGGISGGFYVSRAGIAYTTCLGGSLDFLPGSAELVNETDQIVFRIAVDRDSGNLYLYVTPRADVGRVGHQLKYVLPAIDVDRCPVPVLEGALVSCLGETRRVELLISGFSLASYFVVPNVPPIADAGTDQSVRSCSVVQLDGTKSLDPEGAPLLYGWRLTDAPTTSQYIKVGEDGFTPAGGLFINRFYSTTLVPADVSVGDVLVINGIAYTLTGAGTDGTGPYVSTAQTVIPTGLVTTPWRILKQNGFSSTSTAKTSFYPDVVGFYKFDLLVFDGELLSQPSTTVINVISSLVPRGVIPDMRFFWQYLSNFWDLVEEKERITTVWSATAQIAAAELLNLWQIDYGKSLRDIQRLFQRKWLHYDLLVSEPLPESTSIRSIFSGLDSAPVGGGGLSLSGTTLVISWPGGSTPITFVGPNPWVASQILIRLRTAFLNTSVTASSYLDEGGDTVLRLSAPFPLTVESTTGTLYTVGQTTGLLTGTDVISVKPRTFRVGMCLAGLGIKEDDLFANGGMAYRIVRIVDDASDTLRFQRVVVKEDTPLDASGVWSIPSAITSAEQDFWISLFDGGDHATLEVITPDDTTVFVDVPVLGVSGALPNQLGVDLTQVGTLFDTTNNEIFLYSAQRKGHIPLDRLVIEIPYLQVRIKDAPEAEVLHRNVDFYIEDFRGQNSIRFDLRVWESETGVADTVFPPRLWAETTYLDNRPTIEASFGLPADFTLDDLGELQNHLDYLSAVRGLWFAYLNGPTVRNIRIGAQILLGLPFAEEAGTIEEIKTDFSPTLARILIRDTASKEIIRSYHYPVHLAVEVNPATHAPYAVGDAVGALAPLVSGLEVLDYLVDPRWFGDFLGQGAFREVEKYFRFLVRVDSAIFNLTALTFVRNFVQRIKPKTSNVMFVVRQRIGPDEVSVTDERVGRVTLATFAGPCLDPERMGSAQMWDQPRPGGIAFGTQANGGTRWRNHLDENDDPTDPAPTPPTPDTVTWGLDYLYLCPHDEIVGICCATFTEDTPGSGVFLPSLDSIFVLDLPVYAAADTDHTTPIAWAFDTTLPVGRYCTVRAMEPS